MPLAIDHEAGRNLPSAVFAAAGHLEDFRGIFLPVEEPVVIRAFSLREAQNRSVLGERRRIGGTTTRLVFRRTEYSFVARSLPFVPSRMRSPRDSLTNVGALPPVRASPVAVTLNAAFDAQVKS